jgi:hypothetical protein
VGGSGAGAQKSESIWYGNVPGAGTTATITIGGYANGYITSFVFNVGVIKGSTTTTAASPVTSTTYSGGATPTAVTVPTNGLAVISAYSDNNSATTGVTSSFTNATLDKDQSDGVSFGQTGTMAHLSASNTVTMTSTTVSLFGWVATGFQP